MNIRWKLFWIKDFLTGGKIRKIYNEMENVYFLKGNKEEKTKSKLDNLLKYASRNTSFYKDFKDKSLKEFPVITKLELREKQSDFLSKEFENTKLHIMNTSGSTGTPLTIKQDGNKRKSVIAEVLFFGKIGDYTFGEKQMFFRIWTSKNQKSKYLKLLQNMITEDISKIDLEHLKNISNMLKENKKIKNILSYASTLNVLSKYMIENGYDKYEYGLNSIFAGSEMLQDITRKNLEKIFKCKVFSRYANQENGILGQDVDNGKHFELNYADYYFEFLKMDSDEQAEVGETARIVLTDLYNYAMPIIRYDTGDVAIYEYDEYGNKIITKLYGRKVDLIYNTAGETLSPHVITNNMWGIQGVKQFKFIQIDKTKYSIKLNIEKTFDGENEIYKKFKEILGDNSEISLEYVDEIPVLASGKRKYIENLYRG